MSQQETTRALEQVRQRLNNLTTSLGALRRDLESTATLPSWPSIQNSANLLSHNLASLQATLSSAQPLLTSAHAYPLPSFPGRTQEDLLGQLLRKKLQPPVEDWIDEGVRHAAESGHESNGVSSASQVEQELGSQAIDQGQLQELWEWAGPEGNRVARDEVGEEAFADVFTLAEQEDGIENVVTGLRRKFWESDAEDEGEEGEGEAEKMEVDVVDKRPEAVKRVQRTGLDETRAPMSLEAILRFVNSGVEPSGG